MDKFTFKLWDDAEKSYVHYPASSNGPIEFSSTDEAEQFKDWLLDGGNYPDKAHTVFQVHEFLDGKLIAV